MCYGRLGCCKKSSGVMSCALRGRSGRQYEKMKELLTSKWVLNTGNVSLIFDSRVLVFLCEHVART